MSNTKITLPRVNPMAALSTSVDSMRDNLARSLPPNLSTETFIRAALVGIQNHKDVSKILGPRANKRSIYLAIERAAIDGLLLDGREAVLLPFRNSDTGQYDVTYIPMYQGLLKLARQSGEILTVLAEVVFENDTFMWMPGVDECPRHTADWFLDDRGAPRGVWAMVRTKDGGAYVATMSARMVLGIGRRARNNAAQYDPATGPNWQEWWKKTALRRVLKIAPRGRSFHEAPTPLDTAIDHSDEAEAIDFSPSDVETLGTEELEATPDHGEPEKSAADEVGKIMSVIGKEGGKSPSDGK